MAKQVSLTLIHLMMHNLMLLLKAHIPIIQCVELLEKSEQSLAMKKLLYYCRKELCSGKKISDSFLCFSEYVEPLFYHLLRIGEETGKLEWAINQLVHHLTGKIQLQKSIQQALFYPAVIFTIALLLFFALFIVVIPEFAALFADSHLKLPRYTRVLFDTACFLKTNLVYVLMAIVIANIIMRKIKPLPFLWNKIHTLLTTYGFSASYRDKRYLIEFCQQMAVCLAAGISMLDALALFKAHGAYAEYQVINTLIKRIKTGMSFSSALEEHAFFPVFMIEMIRIGESSGTLANMLTYLADYYHDQLEGSLLKLKAMIEPLIICILGVLIGCLVISIYLPIFNLGSAWQ